MRAVLRLELTTTEGRILEVRHGSNAVMRAGARLIADLFAGRGRPITHMGVGTSDAPERDDFATERLTNDPGSPLKGPTEAAIPADAFQEAEADPARRVMRVRLRATLPPAAAVGTVREAGL